MGDYTNDCFELFDTQGSGTITAAQVGPALRALGKTPSEEELKELLAGAGNINLETFKSMADKIVAPAKEEVLEAFSTFDTNSNGYIALDELKNLMKNLGEGLNEEEISGMEKVAAADDENQVNIRHMVDQLMQE
mmetsp:Transcript_4270/g.10837  ORF Transcript_4270/g.10837 Transcript_4270/m.10837 type:complete len:135 (-) Transcript_4270:68-472(-)